MSYSARKTYGTQKKYSRQAQQLDTKIKGLIYQDQDELEAQMQEIINGWRDAAKGGKWGGFLEALDLASGFTPWLWDDVLIGTAKAANYDKLRSKAMKGVDLSKMQYLGQSAKDADFKLREEGYKALEDLTFGNQMKDVGLDLLLKSVMESDMMEDFMEDWRYEDAQGPGGEQVIQTKDGNVYIPGDLNIDLENISSFEDITNALQSTEVGEYFKVDNKFYQHLDPAKSQSILKSFGDKESFLKQYGIEFEGDVKTIDGDLKVLKPLEERFKPKEFLFGREDETGFFKTFGQEMKDVLLEGPEARRKRALDKYNKGLSLGGGIDAEEFLSSLFGFMMPGDSE